MSSKMAKNARMEEVVVARQIRDDGGPCRSVCKCGRSLSRLDSSCATHSCWDRS